MEEDIFLLVVGFVLYFLPTIVGKKEKERQCYFRAQSVIGLDIFGLGDCSCLGGHKR